MASQLQLVVNVDRANRTSTDDPSDGSVRLYPPQPSSDGIQIPHTFVTPFPVEHISDLEEEPPDPLTAAAEDDDVHFNVDNGLGHSFPTHLKIMDKIPCCKSPTRAPTRMPGHLPDQKMLLEMFTSVSWHDGWLREKSRAREYQERHAYPLEQRKRGNHKKRPIRQMVRRRLR